MRPVALLALTAIIGSPARLGAERIPLRTYTTADGLPTSSVNQIKSDKLGFLWLCTFDGLVRFDGRSFVTFGLEAGLPDRSVTVFLESREGAYWVGTYHGIARFLPDAVGTKRQSWLRYEMPGPEAAQHITALSEDRDGVLWCGTRQGIYRRLPERPFQAVEIGLATKSWKTRFVKAVLIDRANTVWAGTENDGLFRRQTDGTVEHYPGPCQTISALLQDREGRIWAASSRGLCLLETRAGTPRYAVTHVFAKADGLPSWRITALLETADGAIWAGTEGGLGVLAPGSDRFKPLDSRNGLRDVQIRALGVDQEGNLWISGNSYLMRAARTGFLTYGTSDGLGGDQVTSIFEDRSGGLCVANGIRRIILNRWVGNRFKAVQPLLARGGAPIRYMGWGIGQTVVQDRAGDWWIPTGEGLCRFRGIRQFEDLAHTAPSFVYTTAQGLPGNDIFRVFEDPHGGLWVATVDTPGLAHWNPQVDRFEKIGENDAFTITNPPAALAEDRAGDLWVGMFWKGLARRRRGRWQMLSSADVPDGSLWAMLVDRRGRVWIASSSSGLTRVDDPGAENPKLIRYTTRQGLSSDLLLSLAEGPQGQIYIGGMRGIDVLDPESGRVRRFGADDGLAGGDLAVAFCDRTGTLWFGATLGLSRLLPESEAVSAAPTVRIVALRVAGIAQPVSALGTRTISGLELAPNQNHLEVGFSSSDFKVGSPVRYQYRLEGNSPDWSPPDDTRTVSLAGLAPGSYRFQVRAQRDGLASLVPAQIVFRVLPPLWRRWWSLAAASIALSALLYTAYRLRMAQVIEMEKVRTRIAMDLHDDIGSSLSQISILSEVALQEAGTRNGSFTQSLQRVSGIARELAGALGDIVWAINPQRDRLGDLVQRMRRFGEDLLGAHDIDFDCLAPESALESEIAPDIRREVLLVFKEGIHNIARHSGCRKVRTELVVRERRLRLEISDDGVGFETSGMTGGGHGLASMRRRAEQLGGTLEVSSRRGGGSVIVLTVPLGHRSLVERHLFRW